MFKELPEIYVNAIKNMQDFLQSNYKDQLLLFTLTGSASFGKVFENVSDIDFFLIINNPTKDDYERIFSFKQTLGIKCDLIIHSLFEVNHLYLTFVGFLNLYLIQNNIISPIYRNKSFRFTIPKERVIYSLIENIEFSLIRIKRIVYDYHDKNPQLLIKTIGYLLKNYFALQNIYTKNLQDALEQFQKLTNTYITFDLGAARRGDISDDEYKKLINYVDYLINYFQNLDLYKKELNN